MEHLTLSDIELIRQIYRTPRGVEIYIGRRSNLNSPQNLICIKKITLRSINEANKLSNKYWNMRKLNHNNIVKLISVSLEGNGNSIDSLALFMEYCPDGDLGNLITRRIANKQTWTQEELLDCLDQLITGFVHLQNNGVAHRDVKPKNIFIENNCKTFKIGDLGSSRVATGENFTVTGTDSYLSPKVRQGFIDSNGNPTRINHDLYKSDVYSLGMVFLYMTTGQIKEELKQLDDLQNNINRAIFGISDDDYSKIKLLLLTMLQVHEEYRPNFLELKKLFDEIKNEVSLIPCKECLVHKQQKYFMDPEERLCYKCNINSNAYKGSYIFRCDTCGVFKNQTLMKDVDGDRCCKECISNCVLFPDFEL